MKRKEENPIIEELTLLLIDLTSWTEEARNDRGGSVHKAWKGYLFTVLNKLQEKKLIQYKPNNNLMIQTEEGKRQARFLREKFLPK